MKTIRHRIVPVIRTLLVFLLAVSFFLFLLPASAETASETITYDSVTARPSVNGKLHVQGQVLADESGQEVQLRGVSSHGLTWYPDYVDPSFIQMISEDWNCNMIRLAMYTEVYCSKDRDLSLELLEKGIDAAIRADMYVLVDWHILEDYDPNIHKTEAPEFFEYISG